MSFKESSSVLKKSRLILVALLGIPVLLLLDSPFGDDMFHGHGQDIATVLVFVSFVSAYIISHHRSKEILLIGMFVGLAGEFLLSRLLGMYHYRLDNIPMWLAFGHGLIFALVFRISRKKWIRSHQNFIQILLLLFIIIYSVFWLIWDNDWFGFLCSIVFLMILYTAKQSRLFFLIMFIIVCYIEVLGTATGCWYWPKTTFSLEHGISSGNPPVGIAVFYFLFDAVVLWVYLNILHPKLKQRYMNRRVSL